MSNKALLVALAVVLAVAASLLWVGRNRGAQVKFQTPYQTVLLTSGAAYYGKLEGLGTPFPVLRDVYYIQTGTDTQTKQPTSVLLKRGKEWHAPDYMVLNASHILMVEPVNPNSRVAGLIAQMPKQ